MRVVCVSVFLCVNVTMDSPVLLAMVCFRTLASFTIIALWQKKRNNFVTCKKQNKTINTKQSNMKTTFSQLELKIKCWHVWGRLNSLPGENLVTSGPTLSTIPAPSWPRTEGNGLNFMAFWVWCKYSLSVWHTLVATICLKRLYA